MRASRLGWQKAAMSQTALTRLLNYTAANARHISLSELYKFGILLKDADDVLGLREHTDLINGLSRRYEMLRGEATPFQVSLLDAVLPRGASSSAAPTDLTSGATSQSSGEDGRNLSSDTRSFSTTTTTAGEATTTAAGTGSAVPVTAQEYYAAIMELMQEVEAEHNRATAAQEKTAQQANNNSHHSQRDRDRPHNNRGGDGEGRRGKGHSRQDAAMQHNPQRKQQQQQQQQQNLLASQKANMPSLGEVLGGTRAATLESHLNALEPLLRQLSPTETERLVRTLAKLNYTNYEHTVLLTRRGCEVASQLPRHELCALFFNLHKLHTRDSCVPVVNRILEHVQELTAEEVYLLCQALERQENNSTASQRLLTPLVAQALRKLPEAPSSGYHRTLLVAMARYHLQQPATVQIVLRDWVARWKLTSSEKDVLVLMEAATTLAAPGTIPEGLQELVDRLTFLAPTMDLWHVDRVMDLLSTIPMHLSTKTMHIFLTRLENEAGRLSVGQLKFVLHLLSSYPPAKGQVAIVSLAYACAIRAKSMDAETLESIVISLAMLQLFTDDFFSIAHVLQTQKGGMRSFAQVRELFECCTKEMAALPHGLGMLTSVICTLAPSLNDEELSYCRKALVRLGVTDRETLQQIFAKAKRMQRAPSNSSSSSSSSRKRRGGFRDPMEDLL